METFESLYDEFSQVNSQGEDSIPKHIMLGNGFTLSLFTPLGQQVFSYEDLRQIIITQRLGDFNNQNIDDIYNIVGNDDIEGVIHALETAQPFAQSYGLNNNHMLEDALTLKNIMIDTISEFHPEHPEDFGITMAHYEKCGEFLDKFSNIFTTNYDLILYWTRLNSKIKDTHHDGFSRSNGRLIYNKPEKQTVFYLHGGLHFYKYQDDLGDDVFYKLHYTYMNPLRDQIRANINTNIYPITVAEGSPGKKRGVIASNELLKSGFRRIKDIEGALFTFGLDLTKAQDSHLVDFLVVPEIKALCVGMYGQDQDKEIEYTNKLHRVNVKRQNVGKAPIDLRFYDTSTMNLWT